MTDKQKEELKKQSNWSRECTKAIRSEKGLNTRAHTAKHKFVRKPHPNISKT